MEKCSMKSAWARVGLVLSGTMYAILLMNTQYKLNFSINALLAFFLMLWLVQHVEIQSYLFFDKTKAEYLAAGVLSILAVYTGKSAFYTTCHGWILKACLLCGISEQFAAYIVRLAPWCAAALAYPIVLGYFLWFVHFFCNLCKKLWRKADYIDKVYYVLAAILLIMMLLFTYLCTQAFYGAELNGIHYDYDLIYSADSGNLVSLDVFRVVGSAQNDTRQPLYGLFTMPFAQLAWLLSLPLSFVSHSYITILQILQILLLLMAIIMLGSMLRLRGIDKVAFYLIMSFSYPVLIFSLTVEQYLMAVFWLISMLYLHEEQPEESICYIAATGSLLTTGILFPVVTFDRKLSVFVKRTIKLCGFFFAIMILCGRLTVFLEMRESFALYRHYSGADVSPLSKLMQYVNFAGATMFAPASQYDDFTYRYHVSFQMVPVTHWRILGLIVLILAVIGIVFTRKNRFTRICAAWIGFSFVLLGLVGWGTIDNGLLLYSLYFGWAYVAMVFSAIQTIFRRWRYIQRVAYALLFIGMMLVNIPVLRQAVVFAARVYPTVG